MKLTLEETRLIREERMCLYCHFNLYCQKLFCLSCSFQLSALSIYYPPVTHTIVFRQFKVLMKVFLINFRGFIRLRYFPKCTLIVIQSIAKISYISSYVLLRTTATMNFENRKIGVAIYNSFTNIVLNPTSFFKLTCFLNILTVSLLVVFALTR